MTRITDERLQGLIDACDLEAQRLKNTPDDRFPAHGPNAIQGFLDLGNAMRELQAARELLATLAAQSSGIPGSTARADCMAALAAVHIRNYVSP